MPRRLLLDGLVALAAAMGAGGGAGDQASFQPGGLDEAAPR